MFGLDVSRAASRYQVPHSAAGRCLLRTWTSQVGALRTIGFAPTPDAGSLRMDVGSNLGTDHAQSRARRHSTWRREPTVPSQALMARASRGWLHRAKPGSAEPTRYWR